MKIFRSIIKATIATLLIISFNAHSEPLDKKPEASKDIFHPARITKMPEAPDNKPFAEHFVILHISSGDGYAQKLVLNNAQNLANYYGADKVAIEVVAYGPGLRALFKENTNAKRIANMAEQGITFSACANTMKAMGRDKDSLNKHAEVVPGGVVRIIELEEAGWSYIRP
jgi:uncharacterized protein